MVKRKEYLEKLLSWKDEKVIKVITGLRRCGKSTLLLKYQDYLKELGINNEQIIAINFEELEYENLLDYKKLYDYIKNKLCDGKMTYIFLDEIQKVGEFEKVVDSLYAKENTDIYITGSNAYMLSGDLATYLTGRYIEISMLPLSFKEFVELKKNEADKAFSEYLRYGGLPYIAQLKTPLETADSYLEGIYNTVIIKDIEDRQSRRISDSSRRKVTDLSLLKLIAKYLASVVGSQVSVKSVTNYLISCGRKVSPNTVDDYMETLSEAFIFYPVERIDVIGKQIFKTNKKYYMVDMGLRNYVLPKRNYDLGFSIENIVFLELKRRGFKVAIGKVGENEIDFIAQKKDVITYFQVTADMTAEETFKRELKPLESIKGNYEKIILTLDRFTLGNYNGIKVINALDWLLEYPV